MKGICAQMSGDCSRKFSRDAKKPVTRPCRAASATPRGILYRSALYPLSEDGVAIDHVLGAANYRPLRENEQLIAPLIRTKWL